MERAYKDALAQLAVRLALVTEAQLAPLLDTTSGALGRRLLADGLITQEGHDRLYAALAAMLSRRDPALRARKKDATIAKLALEKRLVERPVVARYQQRRLELPPTERAPIGEMLLHGGAITAEQHATLGALHEALYAACPICGEVVNRKAIAPGKPCRCCGWPLAAPLAATSEIEDALAGMRLDAVDPFLGVQIGHCRITRKLGEGGMGAVYLARHVGLDIDVAVKILPHSAAARSDARERFMREARSAAKLEHPHIVRVLDVGLHERTYYMVQELVDGQSLARMIDRDGPFSVDEALRITKDVAAALALAHASGVIHRDIKPDNLMMTREGQVKVADFGLARMDDGGSISVSGQITGSPAYMSPEQADGRGVDARTDICSLGITLYALLKGGSPFSHDHLLVVLRAVADQEVPPLGNGFPPGLDRVIAHMTAKDPARRMASMEEVVRALSAPLDRVVPDRVPPSRSAPERAARTGPRSARTARASARTGSHLAPWGVAAVVLVIAVALWRTGRAPEEPRPEDGAASPIVPPRVTRVEPAGSGSPSGSDRHAPGSGSAGSPGGDGSLGSDSTPPPDPTPPVDAAPAYARLVAALKRAAPAERLALLERYLAESDAQDPHGPDVLRLRDDELVAERLRALDQQMEQFLGRDDHVGAERELERLLAELPTGPVRERLAARASFWRDRVGLQRKSRFEEALRDVDQGIAELARTERIPYTEHPRWASVTGLVRQLEGRVAGLAPGRDPELIRARDERAEALRRTWTAVLDAAWTADIGGLHDGLTGYRTDFDRRRWATVLNGAKQLFDHRAALPYQDRLDAFPPADATGWKAFELGLLHRAGAASYDAFLEIPTGARLWVDLGGGLGRAVVEFELNPREARAQLNGGLALRVLRTALPSADHAVFGPAQWSLWAREKLGTDRPNLHLAVCLRHVDDDPAAWGVWTQRALAAHEVGATEYAAWLAASGIAIPRTVEHDQAHRKAQGWIERQGTWRDPEHDLGLWISDAPRAIDAAPRAVASAKDDALVVLGCADGSVRYFRTNGKPAPAPAKLGAEPIVSIALGRGGLVAALTAGNTLVLHRAGTAIEASRLPRTGCAFVRSDARNTWLVAGGQEAGRSPTLAALDVLKGTMVDYEVDGAVQPAWTAGDVAPEIDRVVGGATGLVVQWSLRGGKPLSTDHVEGPVFQAVYAGKDLLVFPASRAPELWPGGDAKLRRALRGGPVGNALEAKVSPDGRRVLVVLDRGAGRTVAEVWDGPSGRLLRTFDVEGGAGAPRRFRGASFGAVSDAVWVASGAPSPGPEPNSGAIEVWHPPTGR